MFSLLGIFDFWTPNVFENVFLIIKSKRIIVETHHNIYNYIIPIREKSSEEVKEHDAVLITHWVILAHNNLYVYIN